MIRTASSLPEVKKRRKMRMIRRSASINIEKIFGILTWMYKRPLQGYQGFALIFCRQNFLLFKPEQRLTSKISDWENKITNELEGDKKKPSFLQFDNCYHTELNFPLKHFRYIISHPLQPLSCIY